MRTVFVCILMLCCSSAFADARSYARERAEHAMEATKPGFSVPILAARKIAEDARDRAKAFRNIVLSMDADPYDITEAEQLCIEGNRHMADGDTAKAGVVTHWEQCLRSYARGLSSSSDTIAIMNFNMAYTACKSAEGRAEAACDEYTSAAEDFDSAADLYKEWINNIEPEEEEEEEEELDWE